MADDEKPPRTGPYAHLLTKVPEERYRWPEGVPKPKLPAGPIDVGFVGLLTPSLKRVCEEQARGIDAAIAQAFGAFRPGELYLETPKPRTRWERLGDWWARVRPRIHFGSCESRCWECREREETGWWEE